MAGDAILPLVAGSIALVLVLTIVLLVRWTPPPMPALAIRRSSRSRRVSTSATRRVNLAGSVTSHRTPSPPNVAAVDQDVRIDVGDPDGGAFGGQSTGDAEADAVRAARDDRGFAAETLHGCMPLP